MTFHFDENMHGTTRLWTASQMIVTVALKNGGRAACAAIYREHYVKNGGRVGLDVQ